MLSDCISSQTDLSPDYISQAIQRPPSISSPLNPYVWHSSLSRSPRPPVFDATSRLTRRAPRPLGVSAYPYLVAVGTKRVHIFRVAGAGQRIAAKHLVLRVITAQAAVSGADPYESAVVFTEPHHHIPAHGVGKTRMIPPAETLRAGSEVVHAPGNMFQPITPLRVDHRFIQ